MVHYTEHGQVSAFLCSCKPSYLIQAWFVIVVVPEDRRVLALNEMGAVQGAQFTP